MRRRCFVSWYLILDRADSRVGNLFGLSYGRGLIGNIVLFSRTKNGPILISPSGLNTNCLILLGVLVQVAFSPPRVAFVVAAVITAVMISMTLILSGWFLLRSEVT
ncbi:hypothetical transcript [Echinococcus multilocularis]|uniref:Hypothetical transcript n=1 Tax=Echinococcus multilocularis TaxID=6211 RepID=A0A0S4MLK2_ECHMU|nr:hypothetical transcript [Echinococcus multilocularis]